MLFLNCLSPALRASKRVRLSTAVFNRSRFSTAFAPGRPVVVPVGSNGSITLDIYHPSQFPSSARRVIVYLPRGPVPLNGPPEPSSLMPLASSSNATVVRLNYRLSKERRYPTPVHDVLAGYDWVVLNLVRGLYHDQERSGPGNVAVCGEFLGGSLAAALALTECNTHKTGVRAAVFGNPTSDWTAMYQVKARDREGSKAREASSVKKKRIARLSSWDGNAFSTTLPAASLLKMRGELFRLSEDYFDPFASPALFFRTPSSSVPKFVDPLDELFLDLDIAPAQAMRKRRSHRRYPSPTSNLRLPDARFWLGEESVLMDQGIDLAEGMARSNHLYGGPNGTGEGTGWERVEVDLKDGVGCWQEDDLVDIGTWLGYKLRG